MDMENKSFLKENIQTPFLMVILIILLTIGVTIVLFVLMSGIFFLLDTFFPTLKNISLESLNSKYLFSGFALLVTNIIQFLAAFGAGFTFKTVSKDKSLVSKQRWLIAVCFLLINSLLSFLDFGHSKNYTFTQYLMAFISSALSVICIYAGLTIGENKFNHLKLKTPLSVKLAFSSLILFSVYLIAITLTIIPILTKLSLTEIVFKSIICSPLVVPTLITILLYTHKYKQEMPVSLKLTYTLLAGILTFGSFLFISKTPFFWIVTWLTLYFITHSVNKILLIENTKPYFKPLLISVIFITSLSYLYVAQDGIVSVLNNITLLLLLLAVPALLEIFYAAIKQEKISSTAFSVSAYCLTAIIIAILLPHTPFIAKDYYYESGVNYKIKGQIIESKLMLRKAISLDPDGEIGRKAKLYLESRLPRSNNITRNAIKYNIIASNYKTKGQYGKAIAEYKKAIKDSPEFEWAYSNMAHTYYYDLKSDYDKAEELLKRALALNPKYFNARIHLASLYLVKGQDTEKTDPKYAKVVYQKSLNEFNQAKLIDPDDSDVNSKIKEVNDRIKKLAQ